MKRITIDCETSGFDPRVAGIIEVGAVIFDKGLEVAQFSEVCRPHESCLTHPKADEALSFSGLTRAQIVAARPSSLVARDLGAWLALWAPGATIHAYNVEFEDRFLSLEPWMFRSQLWGECIMMAATQVMGEAGRLPLWKGGRWKFAKLSEAAQHFGVMLCGEHRALRDARTAALVYEEILRRRG